MGKPGAINNGFPLSLAPAPAADDAELHNLRKFVTTSRTATGSFFVGKSVSSCGEDTNFYKPMAQRDPRAHPTTRSSTCYQWVGGSISGSASE
mmetsp:Transcript_63755/g.201645  ORF Transcript_63755/g.201645 Transcript_63755/m.201645 type:complete len:93 (+) Transcript_63755:160-438(+)|eukprot:CAMPEP_0182912764 /NCGR_PEP_ID=MMETSP0034_2-20130328/37688_1 /TAXON_ID=156128 /ORGANISM="Nephroselmis pyriformis, Strain CCMP717" /LENGTH=92 /DNA_ID=CAMNT_0025049455 /DNA_START=137 /DNA_END=415 /DNA_ORIENTATION=+